MESNNKTRAAVAVVLLAGMLLRLYLASLDMRVLLPNLLSDDMFYYLKLARNMALGLGVSFDGVNMTNGFHPLYALFLTLMYSLLNLTPEAPVRIALVVLSMFDVLTGYVIYKTLLSPCFGLGRRSALVGMAFWVFNPFVITGTFYGLETAISTFFVSLVIYAYAKVRCSCAGASGYLNVGLLVGVAMLARMDSVFIGIAVLIDLLLQGRLKPAFLVACVSLLVCSPWFAWSYVNFGMLQQDSGAVLSYMNSAGSAGLPLVQYLQSKAGSFYLSFRIVAMFLSSMILPFFHACLLKGKLRPVNPAAVLRNFIVLYIILLFLYYPVFMGGATRRYFQPLLLASSIAVAMAFERVSNAGGSASRRVFVLLMAFNLLLAGAAYWLYRPSSPQSWHLDLYETALWINVNTMPGDVIGGFNSGIIGYFSNRTVVNLDGVINDGAYRAIADKRLFEYIMQNNINYLVDNENTFDAMAPFMGVDNYKEHLKLVYKKPLKETVNQYVVVYEVVADGRQ